MSTTNLTLGIDIGTQSLKIGLYTVKGDLVAAEQEGFFTYYESGGRTEQDPHDWWNALQLCLNRAGEKVDLTAVKAVAMCATSSTVVLTDKNVQPLTRALCWMDQRSVKEEESINHNQDEWVKEVLKYSGGKVSVEWMVTKALWIKNNYDLDGKYILEQLDWMNYQLTDTLAASQCNASCKWNYVGILDGFSTTFFERIGLEGIQEVWPKQVRRVGDQVGKISTSAASALGLVEGTPVYQGGIDAHIGMIGSQALEPGNLCMITGTSFVHLVHHDEPVFQDGLWGPYDSPIIDGHWLLEGGQLSCGSTVSWFLKEFYSDRKDYDELFQELEQAAEQMEIGSHGLIAMDSWQGNRTPYRDPYASGAFIGLTSAHTKQHIYRAILESIAFGTKNVMETFKEAGVPIHRLIAGGGLIKNRLLMQMISDMTQLPIYTTDSNETGAKGSAIIAAYGMGAYASLTEASKQMVQVKLSFQPNPDHYDDYLRVFKLYLSINESLRPFMKTLRLGKEDVHECLA
ncbi:FGGY-family carbohydrate kinase [Alkalicoccobacillus porphyridii]|uniref:Carbohydrate kinase n=1 Tax=Alkalicoccobacillus porphyridii TaxID=2597270 RepID=A0A554A496_9BACI|nr:FGGY-family carbohydrate kinase [Alkalicoccobacillus porphyridii]TSB48520.1 carbohydrate kinase [Alkalicoccobacillus porphyridii]